MPFRQWVSRLARWAWIPTLAVWGLATWIWVDRFVNLLSEHFEGWLYDWHVYVTAARDFLAGELYKVPLVYELPLPVSSFNYPPGSAAIAIPFLVFPDDVSGLLWVVLSVASVAVVAVLTMYIVDARPIWLWAGLFFLVYSWWDWSLRIFLGNNTPLVLLFLAGAVAAHVANRSTMAGVLLGIAIALKLWPAALAVPLARERNWRTLAWAGGTAGLITVGGLLWLGGLDAARPMISALLIDIEPPPSQILLGFTWLRVHTDWWPEWGGYAVAALLLLIPARGRLGYGIATFAGLAAIPNLWRPYVPSIAFAALLVISGLLRRVRADASVPEGVTPPERMPRLDDPVAPA
jgi:hypothetical protein